MNEIWSGSDCRNRHHYICTRILCPPEWKHIAPTSQYGPMSAGQAMVIGAVFCVYGAAWALIV
jgi:hypothetical protein